MWVQSSRFHARGGRNVAGSERDRTGSVFMSSCLLMLIEHDVSCNTAESLRDVPKIVWDPMGSVCPASGSDGICI
eukprot:2571042-Karenia_brevis.AAC.1